MNWNEIRSTKKIKNMLHQLRAVPVRDLDKVSSGRAHFLAEARILHISNSRNLAQRAKNLGITNSSLVRRKVSTPVWNGLLAVILAVVIFFGGTTATVFAAQGSMPDETLYLIKTLSEDTLLSLTPSLQGKLNLILNMTDRRLAEIAALQSTGNPFQRSLPTVSRMKRTLLWGCWQK
jgi:hypothetical protein